MKTELGLAFGSRASATFDRYNEHAIEPQCLHSTVIRELFPTGSANGNAVIAEVHAARAAFLVGVETYGHREPDEHKPPRQRALLAGGHQSDLSDSKACIPRSQRFSCRQATLATRRSCESTTPRDRRDAGLPSAYRSSGWRLALLTTLSVERV